MIKLEVASQHHPNRFSEEAERLRSSMLSLREDNTRFSVRRTNENQWDKVLPLFLRTER
jgi:hypothetical protein